MAPLLEIKGLKTHFSTDDEHPSGCRRRRLSIKRGETLWVVGESGCGRHLRAGLNVYRGRLTYKPVAKSLGLPFSPIAQTAA